ncbi:SMC-Scp complex subunit ScpB [Mariniluteicoccus flavus]
MSQPSDPIATQDTGAEAPLAGEGASLDDATLDGALEALLLMAEEPMSAATLAEATRTPVGRVTDALARLVAFYDEHHRGFELRHLGGGWRYYMRIEHGDLIARWVLEGQQARLSQAALETLSVIAYLQPISRTRVSAVRGVNVDGVVRTLIARGLIEEAGHDEESGAAVFRTTDHFLERMGMASLGQLPPLAPHLPDAMDLEAELGQLVTQDSTAPEAPTPDSPSGGATGDNEGSEPGADSPDHPDEKADDE